MLSCSCWHSDTDGNKPTVCACLCADRYTFAVFKPFLTVRRENLQFNHRFYFSISCWPSLDNVISFWSKLKLHFRKQIGCEWGRRAKCYPNQTRCLMWWFMGCWVSLIALDGSSGSTYSTDDPLTSASDKDWCFLMLLGSKKVIYSVVIFSCVGSILELSL